ncbi:MAG: dimethyl sulfoxide reductase anchor subunit [Burkholderiales bacterium]|nr:dimethyl sulfoxide reductase anchor subunit [Burkholderiales bacterium]
MRPALSVVFLTTLIGAGQGLFLALYALDVLARHGYLAAPLPVALLVTGALVAAALTAGGLAASFFHLGRPERAWRAAAKWRTSWLSREVIALPVFLSLVVAYAAAHAHAPALAPFAGALGVLACLALFVCTAMIYACVKFLQEWASPLTVVNFVVLGLASGTTAAAALAGSWSEALAVRLGAVALVLTLAGLATRAASLVRNARLRPRSTPQTAIGVKHPQVVQRAQGFMGGSFNTREFLHGATAARLLAIKRGFLLLAFVIPAALLAAGAVLGVTALFAVAFLVQYAGLVAERWYFFAQADHPQNLYYRAMA